MPEIQTSSSDFFLAIIAIAAYVLASLILALIIVLPTDYGFWSIWGIILGGTVVSMFLFCRTFTLSSYEPSDPEERQQVRRKLIALFWCYVASVVLFGIFVLRPHLPLFFFIVIWVVQLAVLRVLSPYGKSDQPEVQEGYSA
jgi:hypothetical protein